MHGPFNISGCLIQLLWVFSFFQPSFFCEPFSIISQVLGSSLIIRKTIKSDEFKRLSYRYPNLLTPKHWLQFAEDATAISCSESNNNHILLNAFTRWCNWASMIIRVDKCKSIGIRRASTCSTQFQPKLFVNGEREKPVEPEGSFKYLGRYFDNGMDNS